jgi:phosphoglycolate phosphatase
MAHALIRDLFGGELPALAMFDLDGTLVDSVPDIARAVDATLADFELPAAGQERVRDWVGRGSRRLLADAFTHALGEAPAELLLEQALSRYLQRYLEDCSAGTVLLPGAAELLAALRAQGVALACVTNKPQAITRRLLEALRIDGVFAACIGGDSGAGTKPDPGPLRAIMAQLGAAPAQALMIGDSRHDVDAARAAGVQVIALEGGYNHGESIVAAAPDRVIGALGELL